MSGKSEAWRHVMSKKILVVDDEESIVTLLKYNLERSGYHVVTAMDGEAGLLKAIEEKRI